ncbi:alkaline phosphatase family protein [Brachybacterium hainanense]|uniref:Alkaline phosphatase family protein n=1 Tax=Brachybacterium hainanense TaxID=1541174 RepID=A0ABV6R7B2_9MICO
MTRGRTLLIAVDALGAEGARHLRRLPGPLASAASLRVLPGGPAEAAPSLVCLGTGASVRRTGVPTQHAPDPQDPSASRPWYAQALRVPTLFDAAAEAGLRTAALQWPATAGARIDLCLPLVEDLHRYGDRWTMARETSSPAMWERHLAPRRAAGVHLSSAPPDALVAEIAAEALHRSTRADPLDLLAVRMTGCAAAQHRAGPGSPTAQRALADLAERCGQVLDAFAAGPQDRVLLVPGRPGAPVRMLLHPNTALAAAGLLHAEDPRSLDGDAVVLPDGPCAIVHVRRGSAARSRALEVLAGFAEEHGLALREILEGQGASATTDAVAVLTGPRGILFGASATQRPAITGEDPYYAGPRAVADPGAAVEVLACGPDLPGDSSEGSWADLGASIAAAMGLALRGATARGLALPADRLRAG